MLLNLVIVSKPSQVYGGVSKVGAGINNAAKVIIVSMPPFMSFLPSYDLFCLFIRILAAVEWGSKGACD